MSTNKKISCNDSVISTECLNEHEKELIRIYRSLPIKDKVTLLSVAMEMEESSSFGV